MYPTTHAVPVCCGVWCIGGVCLLIMYVCFCIVVVVVAVIVVVVVGSRQVKTWYFTVGSLVIISPLTWLRSFKILAIFSVVGNVCLIAGTATSTLFGTFFTCFSAICHPRTRRGLCSTSCPYLLDADWCLRSDVTTNLLFRHRRHHWVRIPPAPRDVPRPHAQPRADPRFAGHGVLRLLHQLPATSDRTFDGHPFPVRAAHVGRLWRGNSFSTLTFFSP